MGVTMAGGAITADHPIEARPIARSPTAPRRGARAEAATAATPKALNILILEDVATDAELMQRELRKAGMKFAAKRVDRHADFIAALDSFKPDVVLADCKLPDYSGAEALAHVRRHHPEIPVVIVTGALGDEAAIELLHAGARDYVLKDNLLPLPSAVARAIEIEAGIRAREAAERKLRAANEMLRTTERMAHIGGWRLDLLRDRLEWSEETYRIFGRDPARPVRTNADFTALVHPDDRDRVSEAIAATAAHGAPFAIEFRGVRPDGTERIISTQRAELTFDAAGKVVAIAGTCHDVTEARRAEQKIVEEGTKFRSLVEQNVAAIAIVRDDGTFGYVNPYFARLAGYTPAELIGRPLADLVPESERPVVTERLMSHFGEQAHLVQIASVMQAKDGRRIEILVNASPIVFEGAAASIAVIIDVSERKQAERESAFNAAVLATEHEVSLDGILVVDPQGQIISLNSRFAEMWGVTEEVLATHSDHLAMQSVLGKLADPDYLVRTVEHLYTHPEEHIRDEIGLKDGRVFERFSAPMPRPDGAYFGRVFTFRDISERKQAEENLRASEERFRLVIEHAPDAILIYDFDQNRFIAANQAAEKLFACGRDQILKYGPQHFYPPEQPDRQPVEQSFADHNRRALAGEQITYERRIRNARGQERLCQVTLVRLPSAEQRLLRASFVDVTDERRAQRELAEQVALLATEHELSPDGILVIDVNAKIVSTNQRFGDLFKIPPKLLAAKNDTPVLDWLARQVAHPKAFVDRVHYLNEHPEESSRDEIGLTDGRVIDRFSMPVQQADGSYLGRVWFFRDVTDKIESKRVLQRLNRTLLTLSRGNEIVVHAASERDLVEQMCRSIVETGGYRMAWVGAVQHDAKNILKTVAAAGIGLEYLEKSHHVSWVEGEQGCRLCGGAIRTGEPQTSQNLLAEPLLAQWHAELKERGLAAAAVFPLKQDAEVFAVLSIYAAETDAFNDDEMKLLGELAEDTAYGIRALRERATGQALNERWLKSLEATIGAISNTLEMRDEYTAGHQQRVAKLAAAIARELHLPDHQVQGVYFAGIIHDVGKIGVPAEILVKPGKLSRLQYQLIQAHAEVGYEIVKGIDFPWPIAEIVRQHHERLDGSGYPRGLKDGEILPEAKILAVSDVVEAMMSHRPYRPARGTEAALAEIERGRGAAYDAAAVDACIALFRDKGFTLV